MNYAVLEHKSILNSPRRLQELEEERHTLLSVHSLEGQCIAKFPNGVFIFPEEMEARLRELVGQKIGILRLDGRHYVKVV
jgi:hypothetical protein